MRETMLDAHATGVTFFVDPRLGGMKSREIWAWHVLILYQGQNEMARNDAIASNFNPIWGVILGVNCYN